MVRYREEVPPESSVTVLVRGEQVAERGANYSDKAPTESGEFVVKSDTRALDGIRVKPKCLHFGMVGGLTFMKKQNFVETKMQMYRAQELRLENIKCANG